MNFDFTGKTILITGASSGIGKHFANKLSGLGARLIIGARGTDSLNKIAKQINSANRECYAYTLDVTCEQSINSMVNDLGKRNFKLDGLINNAGITIPKPFNEVSLADWDSVMDTNLRSQWLVTKSCLNLFNKGSSIVNISSILATRTRINTSYCASKAGSSHLTRSLALELVDKDIRVNAVAPGFVKTEMVKDLLKTDLGINFIKNIPMKRAADISDLDGAILLLLSDYSKYITGSVINVDGGLSVNNL